MQPNYIFYGSILNEFDEAWRRFSFVFIQWLYSELDHKKPANFQTQLSDEMELKRESRKSDLSGLWSWS